MQSLKKRFYQQFSGFLFIFIKIKNEYSGQANKIMFITLNSLPAKNFIFTDICK